MTNLCVETKKILKEHGKSPSDIRWIGNLNFRCATNDIDQLFQIEYDSGFGGVEINPNLLVVGDDWWLERHEYDGSEWWEYKELPQMPNGTDKVIICVDQTEYGCWPYEGEEE